MTTLSPATASIRARRIEQSDTGAAARLLAKGFPTHSLQFWQQALARLTVHATPPGLPKYGYLLEFNDTPIGVVLLICSTLRTGNAVTTRCNVSSWYVEPAFKSYASFLVLNALKLKNVTFVNVSAAPHTRITVEAQGFSCFSQGTFVAVPDVNWRPGTAAPIRLAYGADPDAQLSPFERDLLRDHRAYGCICLSGVTAERAYPFVFRPRLVKGFLPCNQLVYCRDIEEFVHFARSIGQFLALRGRPFIMINSNGSIPGLVGRYFDARMPKYFKGPDRPCLGDLAYTETAMFGL